MTDPKKNTKAKNDNNNNQEKSETLDKQPGTVVQVDPQQFSSLVSSLKKMVDDQALSREAMIQPDEQLNLGESIEFNPFSFLEKTCESCAFQSEGRCLRNPPTQYLASSKGTTKSYGIEPQYPVVAMTIKIVDTGEKLPSEFARACGEFVCLSEEAEKEAADEGKAEREATDEEKAEFNQE